MKRTSLLVLALSATTLAACGGLGEAFSAHTDVVAKAGSHELSVTRLGELLGKAKLGLPVNKEVATLITRDLWVPYQLLGIAAAHSDSLGDSKAIDAAAAGMLENARLGRFMESVAAKLPVEPGSEGDYNSAKGGLYSASHILFMFPQDATPTQKDSIRKKAEGVRVQLTLANFADMAKKYSGDNTAQRGGDLGVFQGPVMVKPFTDAVSKLKPGEISPLVETPFGYHIILRNTWEHAKTDYAAQAGGRGRQVAESTYIAGLQATAKIELKSDAATTMKEIAKDPLEMRDSKTVLATYTGGQLVAGRLALVLLASPQSARLAQQITGAPDSLVTQYVKNMAQRDVLLQRADSLKVAVTPDELASLHRDFVQAVVQSWQAMNLDPKSLADSGKSVDAREKIAAARVEAFMDKIMAGGVQPLPIPSPLQIVLMNKYPAKTNAAGIDRAVEMAAKLRASSDSAKAATQPKSAVPLPLPDAGAPQAAPVPPAKKP
ncbi:MAG: peptidylprolyl isomerase [bacterium]